MINTVTSSSGKRKNVSRALAAFLRNKGAVIGAVLFLILILSAIFAPLIAPFDPYEMVSDSLETPNSINIMGTDKLGRDIFSRVIYGSRISLMVSFLSVIIGLVIGVTLGLVAGYYGGWIDMLISRFIDVLLAFPGMLLALIIIAAMGPGMQNVLIAVGIASIPRFARLTRSITLSAKQSDYVTAARVVGDSDLRIMFGHILPSMVGSIMVLITLQIASSILVAAGLSYLGMGAQPPTPEWGLMCSEGRAFLSLAWWVSTFPGLGILFLVMSTNLMGDGLSVALDPRVAIR